MRKQIHSGMPYKQVIYAAAIMLLVCIQSSAQKNNKLAIEAGAVLKAGLINPHNESIRAGTYGFGFGLYSFRRHQNRLVILSGLQADYQKIHNYRNHVVYTTNWTNGTEQTEVELNTNIRQFFIKVPLIFGYEVSRSFYAGAGVELSSLLRARISQEARGNYVEENYPDEGRS